MSKGKQEKNVGELLGGLVASVGRKLGGVAEKTGNALDPANLSRFVPYMPGDGTRPHESNKDSGITNEGRP